LLLLLLLLLVMVVMTCWHGVMLLGMVLHFQIVGIELRLSLDSAGEAALQSPVPSEE